MDIHIVRAKLHRAIAKRKNVSIAIPGRSIDCTTTEQVDRVLARCTQVLAWSKRHRRPDPPFDDGWPYRDPTPFPEAEFPPITATSETSTTR